MNNIKICSRCVMDTSAEGIYFNDNSICNYCLEFEKKLNKLKKNNNDIVDLKNKIKLSGQNKEYDCVVGLSGGVDSCFTLHKVFEMGLRPLVVHMDNGWNSELAQNNIENIVKKLNLDLFTYVIDWNEYKNMMNSFFDSDVIDIELLMDNAMLSVNYQQASKNNIKYILAGTNTATEGMAMPNNMNWFKYDKKNILNILKIYGNQKIKSFPIISTIDLIYYILFKKIKWISFLDYFNYNKKESIETLKSQYNFKPYPYKHYESVFTRFYQGYILPKKFKVDKRKLHFSTLIISKQMQRDDALKQLTSQHAYLSDEELQNDKEYFLKKMSWSEEKLQNYLNRPARSHLSYPSEKKFYDIALKFYNFFK